jgi:galactose oxidase
MRGYRDPEFLDGPRRMRDARRLPAILLVLATAACQDNAKPGPPDALAQLTVTYVCGSDFDLQSWNSNPLTIQYQVVGTSEAGELSLPPGSGGAPSTTRLTTLTPGDVKVSYEGEESATVANQATTCTLPPSTPEPQATVGEWTPPFSWPVVAVHLHLLPNGRVLSWGRVGAATLWDPPTGDFVTVPSTTMLFCSGHSFLADGRLLVTGGHLSDQRGLPDANIFDPATATWTSVESMHRGRWYPTSTTLPDGQVVTLAGTDQNGVEVEIPEVWTGNSWRSLTGAVRALPYYPRTFVAPNGLVFYAGELSQSAYLDVSGSGTWLSGATSKFGRRDYGTAVMYRPGKVMIVGGSDPPDGAPTNTAEVIDLNQSSPSWRYTDPMRHARRHLNATLLPDGTVLVTGGTSSAGFSNPAGAVHAAERWDPTTEGWSLLASNSVNRVYHSTTMLLPDGRLLHTGSGDSPSLPRELNAELFSPPYLFRGPRPEILSAPDVIGYGQEFLLATENAPQVTRVTLVRLSSVTHAFDESQRFLELELRRVAGGVRVAAPSSGAMAPPGPYLLFILTGTGVPSVAKVVRVE